MGAKRVEDIIPPSRRRAASSEPVPVADTYEPSQKSGRPIITLFLILIGALIVGGGVAMLFAGAKVVVHPLEREVPVNTTLEASEVETAPLPFEVVKIEKVATQPVPADGKETVEERASGVVTIYNEFSSTQQRWVTNTRFESPDGRIFRVKEPVVIPGMEDGKPGTVEVTIHADEAGEAYNVGLVDFTIPGLAGSPQFESLYAKAKTPLSGGFIGERAVVSESKAAEVRAIAREALTKDLNDTIADQIPSGFTLLEDSVAVVFESLSNGADDGSGQANIREKGTAIALVFPTDALAGSLAEKTIASYDEDDVTIGATNTLKVSNLPSAGELQGATELSVALEGTVDIVWKVSAEEIKTGIAGKSREAAESVLGNISGIDRAELILRPFWRNSFPTDSEKITVSVNAS
tara:strand:+ start:15048 stop:16271 length:1224 start_codon:yes stop_codon:yes gene_type:complete